MCMSFILSFILSGGFFDFILMFPWVYLDVFLFSLDFFVRGVVEAILEKNFMLAEIEARVSHVRNESCALCENSSLQLSCYTAAQRGWMREMFHNALSSSLQRQIKSFVYWHNWQTTWHLAVPYFPRNDPLACSAPQASNSAADTNSSYCVRDYNETALRSRITIHLHQRTGVVHSMLPHTARCGRHYSPAASFELVQRQQSADTCALLACDKLAHRVNEAPGEIPADSRIDARPAKKLPQQRCVAERSEKKNALYLETTVTFSASTVHELFTDDWLYLLLLQREPIAEQ